MNRERRPLVAGNWKMFHGGPSGVELAAACAKIARGVPGVDMVIAPPFTALAAAAHECEGSGLSIAAQNMHARDSGAFTGEISAPMLLDSGCTWVILGHSERRQYFAETDLAVAEKVQKAVRAGLKAIVCVGETLAEREGGHTALIVERQVEAFRAHLDGIAAIAYEPVWAIGTGKNAGPEEAEVVHAQIRELLAVRDPALARTTRILYGGSVKPENARALLGCPNVDGALVGGASLDPASFGGIAEAAQALATGQTSS